MFIIDGSRDGGSDRLPEHDKAADNEDNILGEASQTRAFPALDYQQPRVQALRKIRAIPTQYLATGTLTCIRRNGLVQLGVSA